MTKATLAAAGTRVFMASNVFLLSTLVSQGRQIVSAQLFLD